MSILEKIGSNKKVMGILKEYGCKTKYNAFSMQKTRGQLSKEVALVLYDYCKKNSIPVSVQDFIKA